MKIEYYTREAYGTQHRYAKDPVVAGALRQLSGHKTITDTMVRALGDLGHNVVHDNLVTGEGQQA
jgi:hypothetical protein